MAEQRARRSEIEDAVGMELLRIHEETYGVGAETAITLVGEDLIVVVLDGLELQPSEKFLIDAGESQGVVEVRQRYQEAIEPTFRAAVERATGRRVTSFASLTKLGPNYAVEVFRLGPRAGHPSVDGVATP